MRQWNVDAERLMGPADLHPGRDVRIVTDVVTRAAQTLLMRLNDVAQCISSELGIAGQLRTNPAITRENQLTIVDNLAEIFGAWADARTLSEVPVAGASLALVRTLLRHGVALDAALRSYREGFPAFWRVWTEAVAAQTEDRDVLVRTLIRTHADVSKYFDRTQDELVIEYEAERKRWIGHELARRVETIRSILCTDLPATEVLRSVDHRFDAIQTAFVFWVDSASHTELLERTVRMAANRCQALSFVSVPVGITSVWVWVATREPLGAALVKEFETDPSVRGAVGRSIAGLRGFRLSHAQSLAAQQVAVRNPVLGRPICVYDEVEVQALLSSSDPNMVEGFVVAELGSLAEHDHEVLRATLAAYLAAGQNASRASQSLFAHRNTVLYRVERARGLLPGPLEPRLLEIMLALRLADHAKP